MIDHAKMLESLDTMAQQLLVVKALLTHEQGSPPGPSEADEVSIAEQIFAWRTSYDWTQDELAAKVGTSPVVIARFEDPAYDKYSLRALRRLADAFEATLLIRFVAQEAQPCGWQSMDTAPRDGRAILLLSAADTDTPGGHPARVAIGHWYADGTAWVDEMGRLDGEVYRLAVTGVWFSEHGWFQPNVVTHWQPLPRAGV